jgi:branched-chain amino acid aminotransferase
MFENKHFPKAIKYWYMDNLHDWEETPIHPMCHALHYGSSVFEGIRAYKTERGSAVFRLPEHIDRFFHSASVLNMSVPYSREQISEAIKLVLRENNLDSAYIRPLLFYSYGNLGLVPKECPAQLMIAAWEWGAYLGEASEKGANVSIIPWRRIHHSQFDQKAKLGGLYCLSTIGGVLAREKGYDEAVYLNIEGNIAEGPGENIFIVKDGVLITNDISESILEGITRTTILEIAKDKGWKTHVGPITKKDFLEADEAFFTGTAAEVAPIVRVTDDSDPSTAGREYTIGSGRAGEITKNIRTLYLEIVQGKHTAYLSWLTYVRD